MLTFPNGSRIQVGHIRSVKDIDQFLGLEYDVILIEETTTLTESKYRALRDANRTSKNFRPRIYSTANPGGIGHTWYNKTLRRTPPKAVRGRTRASFPATIDDNAMIDPDYRRKLEENIGWKLRAHRYGDWDIQLPDKYFSNFRYQHHVIEPCPTHPEWGPLARSGPRLTTTQPSSSSSPRTTTAMSTSFDDYLRAGAFPQDHAAAVKTMLERNNVDETPLCDPRAGPDVFSRHTRRTIADRYADEGLYLKAAVTDRIQGANEIRTRLGDPERGLLPSLFITTNCTRLIECLTELLHDPANPEDVLKTNVNQYGEGGDDTYDALRYGIMSIPSKYVGGMSKGGVWEREDYGWGASKSHRSGGGFILR